MTQLFANNAVSTVADNPLLIGATTLNLAPGTGALFPSPTGADYFYLTLTQATNETTWEIVKCTARSTDALTITRAQESTSAAQWALGSKAELRMTSAGATGFLQKVNDLSDVASAATAFGNIKQTATESATGVVEIATAAETTTGTDDTRAITPLKLTTFAPATATMDTANDLLIAIDASDSNKLKKMAFPSAGKVTTYQVTSSSDISLSQISTQANVGSTFAPTIPTKGFIELMFTGRTVSSGSNRCILIMGIRIGSTNYWPTVNQNGTTVYTPIMDGTGAGNYLDATSAAGGFVVASGGGLLVSNSGGAMSVRLGIEALSIPTGAQTVQIIAADAGAVGGTIKGTTTTTRVNVAIFDHT